MGFKASVVVKEAILQYIFFLFLTRSAGFIIMLKVVGFFIQVDMFWDWQQKTHMALITSLKMTTTKIFKDKMKTFELLPEIINASRRVDTKQTSKSCSSNKISG